jgi:hypothetical protein
VSLPAVRIAILGSRFGAMREHPYPTAPVWRRESREAAEAWTRALVASLPSSALLVVSSEPIGVGAWALAANRGERPELHYRAGALGCPGRTEPEACTWPIDTATAVYVVWDGRSRMAYRLAHYAIHVGKLAALVSFGESAPTGQRLR